MSTKDQFLALLKSTAKDIGVDLAAAKEEVAAFMAERAAHLATISHEPGFDLAVKAEVQSIAMQAGLSGATAAAATERRWLDVIGGALYIAATALA